MGVALVEVFNGVKSFYPDIHNTLENDKTNNVIRWNDKVIYYASIDSIRFTSDYALINMVAKPNKRFELGISLNPNSEVVYYPQCYAVDLYDDLWIDMSDIFRFIVYETLRQKHILEDLK